MSIYHWHAQCYTYDMKFSEKVIYRILVVLLLASTILYGLRSKKLSQDYMLLEDKTDNYQSLLKKSAIPTPTPTPISDYFKDNYRQPGTGSEPSYQLTCNTTIEDRKVTNSINKDNESIVQACENKDLNQWILITRSTKQVLNKQHAYQRVLLYDPSTDTQTIMFDSEPGLVECSHIRWLENNQVYFTCDAFPSGIKGDFYKGGPYTYAYDLSSQSQYRVEACNPSFLKTDVFEGAATGSLACTSLCASDNDCRDDHFCDTSIGACIRECSNNLECQRYPFGGKCIAYEISTGDNRSFTDNQRSDVTLGCNLEDEY